MFAGLFRKQGFTAQEYTTLGIVEFQSFWVSGQMSFDREKKKHRVRWICKKGYELFDVPMANGYVSADFHRVHDMLTFLQRRLVWKKQR